MKAKLNEYICYLAGLMNKTKEQELSMVGLHTSKKMMEERFLKVCTEGLKVESIKMRLEESENGRHIFFYNSKLAKQIRELNKAETKIFRLRNSFTANYIAGMFDAAGHISGSNVMIKNLNASDTLMLENLGIHTRGDKIMNISSFVELISGHSTMLELTA